MPGRTAAAAAAPFPTRARRAEESTDRAGTRAPAAPGPRGRRARSRPPARAVVIMPTAPVGDSRLAADAFGERHLIAGRHGNLLRRITNPPDEQSTRSTPSGLHAPRQLHRSVERPAAVRPVGRRDAQKQRQFRGPGGAHRLRHFAARSGCGSRSCPPYSSVAAIAQRREKLVDQVAVRAVDLHHLEARRQGAPRRRRERLDHRGDFGLASARPERGSSGRKRYRAGRHRLPAAFGAAIAPPPSQGRRVLALRPACAS